MLILRLCLILCEATWSGTERSRSREGPSAGDRTTPVPPSGQRHTALLCQPWFCTADGCSFSTVRARARGEHLLRSHHLVYCGDRLPPRVPPPCELAERLEALRLRNRGSAQRARETRRRGGEGNPPGARRERSAHPVAGPSDRPGGGPPPPASPPRSAVDVSGPVVHQVILPDDDGSDLDLDAVMGPLLDVESGADSMDGLALDAFDVFPDEPEWHLDWQVMLYVEPEPPFTAILPRGVDVGEFAEYILSVRGGGWTAAVEAARIHFHFEEDDMPLVRLAVQLVWFGRRMTGLTALEQLRQGLLADPAGGATAMLATANFLLYSASC